MHGTRAFHRMETGMSQAAEQHPHLPALPGFEKEPRELVYAMIEAGWTGRMTSKGHWLGKAPDGETLTIASKVGNWRSFRNAEAAFRRWLRKQVPGMLEAAEESADKNPKMADVILNDAYKRASAVIIESGRHITVERPWMAHKAPGRGGGTLYPSKVTIERLWSDGTVDYRCAADGCDYVNAYPRSVSRHYGRTHSAKGIREITNPVAVIDPTYTEKVTEHAYTPTQRLLDALMAVLAESDGMNRLDLATAILTWMHDRPDIEHITREPVEPEGDAAILYKIRMLVGQPDLRFEVGRLEEVLAARTRERDDANARLVEVERDLGALRDLIDTIGKGNQS